MYLVGLSRILVFDKEIIAEGTHSKEKAWWTVYGRNRSGEKASC